MIPRYSRPEMTTIWETENRFKIWLEVEMLICEAQEEIGLIPAGTTKKIRHKAKFDVKRVDDANMVLGISLARLKRYEEAEAAFNAAKADARMQKAAEIWIALMKD